ncbi:hypothetical protein LWI28_020136 [Acer negundo]|uniref:Uncharacterized protein n=1 Tax=Acer negundo TaxID=4023 RepID=A0AAD5IRV4_ACENE|nr:hypothetical protein LWI28_020136 [Acer negundo]
MLKDEDECYEEEEENTAIVFDSGGELIEVLDPEPTPINAYSGSDLVSPMLNFLELEGVKPETETRPFVKEIKSFDSTIVTGLSQLQEEKKILPVPAQVESKSDDLLQTSPTTAKVQILDFSVTIHALKGVHYRFRSTLSGAATIDSLDSDELKETRGDPNVTLTDETAHVASMPIQLKEMKIVGGDRLRSRPRRLPTLFLGVV